MILAAEAPPCTSYAQQEAPVWPFQKRHSPDLEERVERIERELRDLRLDWDTTYEKFATLFSRFAKRLKASQTAEPEDGRGPVTPPRIRDFVTGGR